MATRPDLWGVDWSRPLAQPPVSPPENAAADRFEVRRQAVDQALHGTRVPMHTLAAAVDTLTERCSSADAKRIDAAYENLLSAFDALQRAVERARAEV